MNRLNLLPTELKKEIEISKKNAKIAQNLWKLLAIFFIMLGMLIIVGTLVRAREMINSANKDAVLAEIDDWKGVESGAKDFAARLGIISKIKKDTINWNLVLDEVSKSTPADVRLLSMDYAGNGAKRINFSGEAMTDKDVVTFRELLSKSKIFEFIDIESITSSSAKGTTNVPVRAFTMTANLKVAEVKK
jgi:Tfp pilus assembly protein PilN